MSSSPAFQLAFEQGPGRRLLLTPGEPFTLLAVTDSFLRSTGMTREALVGRPVLEVLPALSALRDALARVLTTKQPVLVETLPDARPSAGRPVLTPLCSSEGELRSVLLQLDDGQEALFAALDRSEARYRVLFESIDDGYCLMHLLFDEAGQPVDYRFLETNAAFEEQTGLKNAVGRTALELVPNLDASWFQLYGRVALTGEPTRFENHAPAMGRWFEVFANRVGPPEERLVALVFKNITARKQAEQGREQALANERAARAEAEAERRKLYDLFMQTPIPICILEGPRHTFALANPRYQALVGDRAVVGKPLLEALPDLKDQGFDALLDRVVASGEPFFGNEVPMRLAGAAGDETFFVNFVYAPKRNAAGEVDGVLVAAADVTAQVLARGRVEALVHRLREAEKAQQRLLEALGDQPLLYVALIRGPELRFEMANALYRQMVGGRDVVGRTLDEALPELRGQGFDTLLTRVLETGEPVIGHEVHARVDRRCQGLEDTYFNHVYHAVLGPTGAPEAVLVLGQDVTDEVRHRREAERQQQERSAFEQQLIGIVSHDLRNPLNVILMTTTVLAQREALTEAALKRVLRIKGAAERMGRMVRDLLDFTQARLGGGIPLNPAPMDLHTLVQQTVEEVRISHEERELRVEARGDGGGAWDGDRLAQVVQNLVSNALKYSPEHTPVTVRSHGGEDGRVSISVHNEGAPIPPEALGRLFQPMERLSSQVDRLGRSVGLGLYIVKHIVDAHGGTVDVTSSAGEGTTFTVRLPRRRA